MISKIENCYRLNQEAEIYSTLVNLHESYMVMCGGMFDRLNSTADRELAITKLRQICEVASDIAETNNHCILIKVDEYLSVIELDRRIDNTMLSPIKIFKEDSNLYLKSKILQSV